MPSAAIAVGECRLSRVWDDDCNVLQYTVTFEAVQHREKTITHRHRVALAEIVSGNGFPSPVLLVKAGHVKTLGSWVVSR